MAKEKTPSWVTTLIRDAVKKAGTAADLAKEINISPSNFVNYESGTTPSVQIVERLIRYLGGDIAKALPSGKVEPYALPKADHSIMYENSPHYNSEMGESDSRSIWVMGQVAAGKVTFAGEDQHFRTVDSLWGESRYWTLTTGSVVYLEVQGESMAPDYMPGEIIACRTPSVRAHEIPSGTPCIFQEGDDDSFTFKIMRHGISNEVIGQPLNPDFPFVIFKKKDVSIPLVVLGKVQLQKREGKPLTAGANTIKKARGKK